MPKPLDQLPGSREADLAGGDCLLADAAAVPEIVQHDRTGLDQEIDIGLGAVDRGAHVSTLGMEPASGMHVLGGELELDADLGWGGSEVT